MNLVMLNEYIIIKLIMTIVKSRLYEYIYIIHNRTYTEISVISK